jgi:hypothetical protein
MLFQDDGREKGGFQAMGAPVFDDAAKAAQRRTSVRFVVVGKPVQESLDR